MKSGLTGIEISDGAGLRGKVNRSKSLFQRRKAEGFGELRRDRINDRGEVALQGFHHEGAHHRRGHAFNTGVHGVEAKQLAWRFRSRPHDLRVNHLSAAMIPVHRAVGQEGRSLNGDGGEMRLFVVEPEQFQAGPFITNHDSEHFLSAPEKPFFFAEHHLALHLNRGSFLNLLNRCDFGPVLIADGSEEQEVKDRADPFLGEEGRPLRADALEG